MARICFAMCPNAMAMPTRHRNTIEPAVSLRKWTANISTQHPLMGFNFALVEGSNFAMIVGGKGLLKYPDTGAMDANQDAARTPLGCHMYTNTTGMPRARMPSGYGTFVLFLPVSVRAIGTAHFGFEVVLRGETKSTRTLAFQ